MQTRRCAKCNAMFFVLWVDEFTTYYKRNFCPLHRCTPGRHRWTLIKKKIVCVDCGKLRWPLAVAVERDRLKRRHSNGSKHYVKEK